MISHEAAYNKLHKLNKFYDKVEWALLIAYGVVSVALIVVAIDLLLYLWRT